MKHANTNVMKTMKPFIAFAAMIALSAMPDVGLQAQTAPAKAPGKPQAESMMTATGEVVKITAESIEIKDLNGKVEIYAITSETKYGTKMKPMKHGDLKMGEHVTVSFEKKNGKMVAMVINKKAKLKPANPSVKK